MCGATWAPTEHNCGPKGWHVAERANIHAYRTHTKTFRPSTTKGIGLLTMRLKRKSVNGYELAPRSSPLPSAGLPLVWWMMTHILANQSNID